jgi:L-iditol 2-dehydrogenase
MTWRQQRIVVLKEGRVGLETIKLAGLAPGEVLLAMDALGVCSSDVHIWCGRKHGAPGVLGHEGAGTVIAAGPGVDWVQGERAVVNPLLNCGKCESCRCGDGHICPTREIIGYNGRGLYGDCIVVPANALLHFPDGLASRHGQLVEPFACVIHAQSKLPKPPAATMVILGTGPMGVMHAVQAKVRGVKRVWIVDSDPGKLALARRRGIPADQFIEATVVEDRVRKLSEGRGADVVVIANSTRAGHEVASRLCADQGVILAFASIIDRPGEIDVNGSSINMDELHRRESSLQVEGRRGTQLIVGAIGFRPSAFRDAAALLATEVDGERFITRETTLDHLPQLIPHAWSRELKILVHPAQNC